MPGPDAPVVVVTGALAPYTHRLYTLLQAGLDRPLHVLACTARESARQWHLDTDRRYRFAVLPGLRWHRSSAQNHYLNPAVVPRLLALAPAAVVLNDFAPTMAIAAAALRLRGIGYGIRTDGVPETDPGTRSTVHRGLRRLIVPGARFGIGPSEGSRALLERHGLGGPYHLSPLFPAWTPTRPPPPAPRPFDVLFCGSLNEETKGALFFTAVMAACAARGRRLRVRVVGEGPAAPAMRAALAAAGHAAQFDGFLQQDRLEEAYGSATLFHFPTRGDVWGIVVQEALQTGTAVIASPLAGASRELLVARGCGRVLPLDVDPWAQATLSLLDDAPERARLASAAAAALPDFTAKRAAEAYLCALRPLLAAREKTPVQGPNRTSSV